MIAGNRYFNNPQIGQALSNIASAFIGSPAEDANNARAQLFDAQRSSIGQQMDGLEQLAHIFTMGADADPAAAYGAAARGGILDQLPEAFLGFSAATNPGMGDDSFSRLMMGAGMGADETPVGLGQMLANELAQQRIREAGALERQQMADLILNEDERALIADPTRAGSLGGMEFFGPSSPLTLTEAQGGAFGLLPPALQQDIVASGINVENVMTPDGPRIASRADAIGQAPLQDTGTAPTPRNYTIMGADGSPLAQSSGYISPDGRLVDIGTQQPVQVPEGAQVRMEGVDGDGGMVFEADGQGGFRLMTGGGDLTVSSQTNQQRTAIEADRTIGVLTQLLDQMGPDDVGVRGNVNEYLTRTIGQIMPELGRPDVVGDRSLMVAAREQVIQQVTADPRLSDADFQRLQRTMPQTGLFESFEGAQASLAEMLALMVYNREHARFVLAGQQLPPFGPEQALQLVQDGVLTPDVASVVASARNWSLPGATDTSGSGQYQPGYEEGGYRFTGGDPTDQANWERVQ